MRIIVMVATVCACTPTQPLGYKTASPGEKPLKAAEARVVTPAEAERAGLPNRPLEIEFAAGRDGTELITEFLKQADAAKATLVTDLAIYIETTTDGKAVECRSEVVPESVTETRWHPDETRRVSVQKPVTQVVTEQEYRCKTVMGTEMRSHSETEQQCGTTSEPVSKMRTVYTTSYDSMTHMARSEPRTEYYTEYESHYECKSVPVQRMRSESVSKQECGLEPVTRTVTRFEFQLENQYIPAHLEQFTRQRLHELEPACYALQDSQPAIHANRIQGRIFVGR